MGPRQGRLGDGQPSGHSRPSGSPMYADNGPELCAPWSSVTGGHSLKEARGQGKQQGIQSVAVGP